MKGGGRVGGKRGRRKGSERKMYSSLLFKQLKLKGLKEMRERERERELRGGQYDFSLESYEDIRDQNFLERDLTIERDPQKEKS